jgi:hypothetical protein
VVFERWAAQIRSLLWEARPLLQDDVDTARLARFIIATLEGALLMARVHRDAAALEGIAYDLKRFIAMHVRDAGPLLGAAPGGAAGDAGGGGTAGGGRTDPSAAGRPDALAVLSGRARPAARPSATSRGGAAAMPAGRVVAAAAQRVSA